MRTLWKLLQTWWYTCAKPAPVYVSNVAHSLWPVSKWAASQAAGVDHHIAVTVWGSVHDHAVQEAAWVLGNILLEDAGTGPACIFESEHLGRKNGTGRFWNAPESYHFL